MGTRGDYLNQFNMDILRTSQFGSITTNYNTSTSTSESTGQVIGNIMTMALGIGGTIAMQGAESKAAARAENAAVTNKQIGTYTTALQNVETIKSNIESAKGELSALETKLTNIEAAPNLKAALKEPKKPENTSEYDTAKLNLDSLKSAQSDFNRLKEATSSESLQTFASNSNFVANDPNRTEIKFTISGDDVTYTQLNENNFKRVKTEKGKDTTTINDGETDYQAYKKTADSKATQIKTEISTRKNAFLQKQQSLASYNDNQPVEDIDTAINTAQSNFDNLQNTATAKYYAQKQEYDTKMAEYDDLIKSKPDVTKAITDKKAEIKKLETVDLPKAKKVLSEAQKAITVDDAIKSANDAKSNYSNKKDAWTNVQNADGPKGKRTWWNKLWGTNQTAEQKELLAEKKAAKKEYKDAKSLIKYSGLNDKQLEQLVKAGTLTQQDVELLKKNYKL